MWLLLLTLLPADTRASVERPPNTPSIDGLCPRGIPPLAAFVQANASASSCIGDQNHHLRSVGHWKGTPAEGAAQCCNTPNCAAFSIDADWGLELFTTTATDTQGTPGGHWRTWVNKRVPPSPPSPPPPQPGDNPLFYECRPGSGPCNPRPSWPVTYLMNESTAIMAFNATGYVPVSADAPAHHWALKEFDWVSAMGVYGAARPMNYSEMEAHQIAMAAAAATKNQHFYTYRNMVKAIPVLRVVREKLEDPAYHVWFVNFSQAVQQNHSLSSTDAPVCDESYSPPLCSHLYHDMSALPQRQYCQIARIPGKSPYNTSCDTGSVPIGSYLFDFRAANVSVNGQTLWEWYIEEYIFDKLDGAGNPHVSGFYIDDIWNGGNDVDRGPSECSVHWQQDTGMSDADVTEMINAQYWVTDKVYAALLERGKFALNQFLNNDWRCPQCGDCAGPWIKQETCATDLRRHCNATGPVHTRAMLYGITNCGLQNLTDGWTMLPGLEQDVANFLLLRGPYAYLSAGFSSCSYHIGWNSTLLDADYGEPIDEICQETELNVFTRRWSRATISMNCSSWTPTITWKSEK